MNGTFTMQDAYNLQINDLCLWAKRLNTETYLILLAKVIERNSKGYTTPYNVLRGNDLTNIIVNINNN